MGKDIRCGGSDGANNPTTPCSHLPLGIYRHSPVCTAKRTCDMCYLPQQSYGILWTQSLGAHCSNDADLCFELLGFDILLDSKYTPWLLEVNHAPSFRCDTCVDDQVKSAVLTDTICSLELSPLARKKFNDREKRALINRLYKPKPK